MSRRRSNPLAQFQRDSYLVSRAAGDLNAAQRGRLPQRLVKRVIHRKIIGLLRKGGLW